MEPDVADAEAPFGSYEIGEELGRGTSGIVLCARHRGLDREVAIKRLPRLFGTDPELRARFLSEARLLASLDHPHIVRIYDFVEADGVCALVMERLAGGTLWDCMSRGEVSPQAACAVIVATCSALDYAHGKGVLHRDIKPQNLMFSDDRVVKVTDFGIAKVLGGEGATATQTGHVLGTPAYIAPEQAQGAVPGPAIDIYATGVLLYLLLCGELPFPPAADAISELYQKVHLDPVPLLERDPRTPPALAEIAARALARDPAARFASARELAVAVAAAASEEWGRGWAADSGVALLAQVPAAAAPGHAGALSRNIPRAAPRTAQTTLEDERALLERDRELQALCDALQDACEGEGTLVVISGAAGTGKTRLAHEALRQGQRRQMHTLWAHGSRAEREAQLGVVRQLLGPAVRELRDASPPELLGGEAALAADAVTADGPPRAVDDAALDEAICDLTARLAARTPLALVVDDVHWADAASLRVLLAVVKRLEGLRVALVLTARLSEPGVPPDLVDRLTADRFAPHLRLEPLSEQAVELLLRARGEDVAPEFSRECWAASRGNPARVFELVAAVEAAGLEPTAANAGHVWDLAPVPAADRSDYHVGRARQLHAQGAPPEAVAGELLVTDPVREPWVVEQLRAAAASAVSGAAFDETAAYLERALQEQPAAQERAEILFALGCAHERAGRRDDANRVLDEALVLADDPRQRAELLLALGELQAQAGEWTRGRDTHRRAAELARRLSDGQLLARAALGYGLGPGEAEYVIAADDALVALLEEALAADVLDAAIRARLLSRLAVELHLAGSVDRCDTLSRQAVELAQTLGDGPTELVALYSRLTGTWAPDDPVRRVEAAEELVRRALQLDDAEMAFRGRRLKLRALLHAGDVAAADREIDALEQHAAATGAPAHRWQVALYRAMRALHDGRADDGERLALEALETGRRARADAASRCFDGQIALHRWIVGRTRALIPALREAADACPWLPVRRAALGFALADLGRRTEATAHFAQLAFDDFDSVPYDGNWLMTMTFASLAAALLGDERRAALLYETLEPYADRIAVAGDCTITWGPVATALGVLAAELRRFDAAAEHFEHALEWTSATGAAAQTVFAQRECARMLLARRRPGDLDRAASMLDDALGAARQLGFARLAETAAALRALARR